MQKTAHPSYPFDDFTVDLAAGCLMRKGQEVKLRPKSFEALRYLVENGGRLVSKDELMHAIWPDSFVTENSLVKCLRDVRMALDDESQRYIRTVPKRGYIFIGQISENTFTTGAPPYKDQVEVVRVVIEETTSEAQDSPGTSYVPVTGSPGSALRWRVLAAGASVIISATALSEPMRTAR